MIQGQFDVYGRPYVQGRIYVPRLRVDGYINFLMDTGADSTCLHPEDATQINLPFDELRNRSDVSGIGGNHSYYHEPAFVFFIDGTRLRLYRVTLSVAKPHKSVDPLPSLLGRDVLNHWYMRYDPTNDRLDFLVRYADFTTRIS